MAEEKIAIHPHSPLGKALDMFNRAGVMMAKRGFKPEDTHILTALMLASCMMQRGEVSAQNATAKRIVEQAREFIDTALLVAEG